MYNGSMRTKYVVIVAILFALALGGFFLMQQEAAPTTDGQNPAGDQHYSNAAYGLSFSYPSGYVLSEMDAPGSGERAHHVITLIRREDVPLPVDGEGPPAITIDIFQNDLDGASAETWIRNTSASNFKLGDGNLASTSVGGLLALSYRWSGLYEGTTIVVAQEKWVYAFTVTYLELGAPIVQDFVAIRDSVRISP